MNKIIQQTTIKKPPVFLLGHWRGGTTYLHNLLSKDDDFGFFTTFDAYLSSAFLSGEKWLKPIVSGSLPERRPMDDVLMGADLPQEEEYALGGVSKFSYYHGWVFPKNMHRYNRYVWLDDVSFSDINKFKEVYLYLLKKQTLKSEGKQLLLKNPSNTARIKVLLDMFPNAKFIHIQRNPYHQFLSMVRFMSIVIPLYCVQRPPSFSKIVDSILDMYEHMYRKYVKEKRLIPKENLLEIRYEDFVDNPLMIIERIYNQLHFKGFSEKKQSFQAYILAQSEIHPAQYEISDEVRDLVYSRWKFAFQHFGYDR